MPRDLLRRDSRRQEYDRRTLYKQRRDLLQASSALPGWIKAIEQGRQESQEMRAEGLTPQEVLEVIHYDSTPANIKRLKRWRHQGCSWRQILALIRAGITTSTPGPIGRPRTKTRPGLTVSPSAPRTGSTAPSPASEGAAQPPLPAEAPAQADLPSGSAMEPGIESAAPESRDETIRALRARGVVR